MDVEKLLEIAQSDSKEEEKPQEHISNHTIIEFLKDLNVAEGPNKVPGYKIYYEYMMWPRFMSGQKCGKTEFFRQFKKEYKQKRTNSCRYYMLNDCFDLSEEALEKARKYDKKYQTRQS